jgi:hypothetical protein
MEAACGFGNNFLIAKSVSPAGREFKGIMVEEEKVDL